MTPMLTDQPSVAIGAAAHPERRASRRGKVVLVMPAYNTADTLRQTWGDIPAGYVDESILVDDASRDDTVAIARGLGIRVLEHARNRGYGGN